jgi:MFS family permease
VYTVEKPIDVEGARLGVLLRRGWPGVGANVWFLGLTSFLTDVSSEMVTSVLPFYLVVTLGLSPLGYGFVEGLQHGVSALLRLASGALADRLGRYKEVAAAGYALSAASRLAILGAGANLAALATVVAADRAGKGLRTSPRDALVSLAARPEAQGLAFGVHRSLDALGAMLGPVVAFLLLAGRPDGFRALFIVSFLVALAGVGAVVLLVRNPPGGAARTAPAPALGPALRDPAIRRLALAAGALGLAVVSDGFLYLLLQRRSGLAASDFPLLFVGTALTYALLAVPLGRLADRLGRRATFLAGHALLLPAYATAALAGPGWAAPIACVVWLGAYYAATDGVLMALAARHLPAERRASGFAVVTTTASLARFAGAALFGLAWSAGSAGLALGAFGALLVAALALAARALPREAAA